MSLDDDEKMIVQMTFKCPVELKEVIEQLAVAEDTSSSMFIRNALVSEVQKRKKLHDSLSKVFRNSKTASQT